jgi:hypothetical protein
VAGSQPVTVSEWPVLRRSRLAAGVRAVSARARRLAVLAAAIVLALSLAAPAQAELERDIDLTSVVSGKGLFLYSQLDRRWGGIEVGPNVNSASEPMLMGDCGCPLAIFATVFQNKFLKMLPWYPVPIRNLSGSGTQSDFSFSPIYLNHYLRRGNGITPVDLDWGYDSKDPSSCGVNIVDAALAGAGQPFPAVAIRGIHVTRRPRLGPNSDRIDRSLDPLPRQSLWASARIAEPVVVRIRHRDPGGALDGFFHAQLIAGWDNRRKQYLVLDPAWPTGTNPKRPVGGPRMNYEGWENDITHVLLLREASGVGRGIRVTDDPAPIELLGINPDGRRTGFDPTTATELNEDDGAPTTPRGTGRARSAITLRKMSRSSSRSTNHGRGSTASRSPAPVQARFT